MKRLAFFASISFLLLSCSGKSYLSIVQDGQETAIRDLETQIVSIRKAPFQIRAKIKPYDGTKNEIYKIALIASESPEMFAKAKPGDSISEGTCFSMEFGMASEVNGGSLFVEDDGFNNLYYELDESLGGPMKLVKKSGNAYIAHADINALIVGDSKRPIAQYRQNKLYLMFFYDGNLNNSIEAGELFKVALDFKTP